MSNYSDLIVNRRQTPQSEQADPAQVQNSAGGFVFSINAGEQLKRFLILGSDAGSFYASPRELTRENAAVVEACLDLTPAVTCGVIASISESRRAVSNAPAVLATAIAICHPKVNTKVACGLVNSVCRIGTDILMLCDYLNKMRGWGKKARRAVSAWYEGKNGKHLAHQVAKYKQRGGWSHRDALRRAHPQRIRLDARPVIDWACGRIPEAGLPELLRQVDQLKTITHAPEIAHRIKNNHDLTWEMLPSESLKSPEVWMALLERGMPLNAMVRNLGRMGSLGLLEPFSEGTELVMAALDNGERLRAAGVHPVSMLKALMTYRNGRGHLGKLSWLVNQQIVEACEGAFYQSFDCIEPTGKRTVVALDVSGSMSQPCSGASMISCAQGAAAMAMATVRSEKNVITLGFSNRLVNLGIDKTHSLGEVLQRTSIPFGGTDCSAPIVWAHREDIKVDTFIVYTDNETWAGNVHPHQALRAYRNHSGLNSKLIVVGMASNRFTIADPNDIGMLDCVGFDTNTPKAISEFSR